jgi:DNA repair protein RecN (Recombination protein N)
VLLEELLIRDVGVIDEVTLAFAPGLNVLTGETGAGKTMVVSALELLLGARADADRIRAGAGRAIVEGRLHPPPRGAEDWVEDGDDLVVTREVASTDGETRSRARIGGRLASVSALAGLLEPVMEIHGQSESVRLARPDVQRALLDRSGGEPLAQALTAYREAWRAWRAAAEELAALRADDRERARELDRLRFEVAEIDAVGPVPSEEDALEADLRRLEHVEALRAAALEAAAAIGDDGAARDALGTSVAALRGIAGVDEGLDRLLARAEGLAAEAQDVAWELSRYAEDSELDPERLETLRRRRADLAGLARKYGPDAAAIAAYAGEARARLERLEGGVERAAALEASTADLLAAVSRAADVLRAGRVDAAERLARTVGRHLEDLAMPGARLVVSVEPREPGPDGADRVAFLLAAGSGEAALPLGKAASGGERSRVALAVRLALADADEVAVFVFDEVDAGIGGAVGVEVGRKLSRLAQGRQVLCVTHLAQLAAFADAHFAVSKDSRPGGRARAAVRRLGEEERLVELSRMLGGSPDSELAAGHAAELRAAALAAD